MVGDEELALRISAPHGETDLQGATGNGGPGPNALAQGTPRSPTSNARSLRSLVQSIKAEAEKNAIAVALEKTGWNRKAASRMLKVSYRTVLYKIEQYKLVAPSAAQIWRSEGFRGKESRIR